jgi:hypothetical protein
VGAGFLKNTLATAYRPNYAAVKTSNVGFWQILLQKSFCTGLEKFSGL